MRVSAKTDRRRNGPEETLVVFRERQHDGTIKHDYYLSNATAETPLVEWNHHKTNISLSLSLLFEICQKHQHIRIIMPY